jgi:glucose-1-phosphate thymidylyltransferase
MNKKGIILAGGTGSRLYPLTISSNKHLLPIYDKPMIFYSLSTLMIAGIKEIALITSPKFMDSYKALLGDGSEFGLEITMIAQETPKGLPDAFILGEKFIGNSEVVLILGDNLFFGHGLSDLLLSASKKSDGSNIFLHHVEKPTQYGVIELSDKGNVLSIEEKPEFPKSNLAITGLYFFDSEVVGYAKHLSPSSRNELEIVDLLKIYQAKGKLNPTTLGRGFAWLDTGTPETLMNASHFISTLEKRQGLKIACLEEIAFQKGWIDSSKIEKACKKYSGSSYGSYLETLI